MRSSLLPSLGSDFPSGACFSVTSYGTSFVFGAVHEQNHTSRKESLIMMKVVFDFLDRFIPAELNTADPDAQRRCRLLVACCFGLTLFAQPFLYHVVRTQGYMSPTAWVFTIGSVLTVCNPFLLLSTGSHRLPGMLFSLEVIIALAFMAYFNGGYLSASLVWNPAIPLLATALVGPTWGGICVGVVLSETIFLYALTEAGYPFPQPLAASQMRGFQMAGTCTLVLFIWLLSWLYEVFRKNALVMVEQSVTALRRSEAHFRSLIENGSDFLVILNADGTIRYGSPSIERLLGHTARENYGKNALAFVHPDDLARVADKFAHLVNEPGTAVPIEFRFRHHDGSWRDLEAIGKNLLQNEAVRGIIVNARDVTERKAIDTLKDELVSTVSHELRTPLSSLRGVTELMLEREFPQAQQREFLTIMQQESVRLTNLINDFLDLQRMEAGQQNYTFGQVDLLPLLHDAVAVFSGVPDRHQVKVLAPATFPPVRADADRIRQVLANLLSNALKFSPDGGEVIVSAHQEGHEAIVAIADSGTGIAPEVLPSLFTKFQRGESAMTRRISGTGLGLALVKEIVTAHGGRVSVESEVGKGSTFFFTLPVLG